MKRILIVISLILCSFIFLSACNKETVEETKKKELVFIEKTTDYSFPSFIFSSSKDKKYYIVEVSNWDYDQTNYQSGEVVSVESKKGQDFDIFDQFLWEVFEDEANLPEDEAFILDEWRPLIILTDYTTSKESGINISEKAI